MFSLPPWWPAGAILLCCAWSAPFANQPSPLPDPATLLRDVQLHQKQLDEARENYTFRALQTTQQLDSSGNTTRTITEEREVFYVKGHEIQKLIRKDGKDLSAEQARKEQDRVDKEVARFTKSSSAGADKDGLTVGRLLPIATFSRPRRVSLNGRSAIALDFAGDPHARTHDLAEQALKKVGGTIWIDEADHEVSRLSATLDENYHLGFGLVASVTKGSNVIFDQQLIRNEAWLPTAMTLHFQARAFLVKAVRVTVEIRFDQYKKFNVEAVQQPVASH